MQIKNLRANKRNPRRISENKREMLRKSVDKFGDLSGLVFNRRTNSLVGGHQRSSIMPPDSQIKITDKYEKPTAAGTIAEGYALINGEKWKYREVDWDEKTEAEAMLAANKHSGEWDRDGLKLLFADIPSLDISLAGFERVELQALDIKLPEIVIDMPAPPAYRSFGEDASGAVDDADRYEEEPEEEDEDEGEKYLAENPGPDSSMNKEVIDVVNRNAFDAVTENTESKLQKHLVVIECETKEEMFAVKEKIRALDFIKDFKAKMF